MVNLDMLGGLKSALERGDSLEKAIRTLLNANYKKEEIEEAAKGLADFKPEREIQPVVKALPKIKEIIPSSSYQVPAVSAVPAKARSIQELKTALEREHSLKKAMLILFNSGYKIEEIIKAARDLLEFGSYSSANAPPTSPKAQIRFVTPTKTTSPQQMQVQQPAPPREINIPTLIRIPGQIPLPPTLVPQQQQAQTIKSKVEIQRPVAQKPVQKVSTYEKPKKERPKGRTIIIVLVSLLIFLVGLETVIFVFKQQFINLLNSFFG